jgi:BON domain
MKKRLFMLGIGFFLFLAVLAATAQTPSQTQTPPASSTTPATQVGSGAQTKAGTPAPSTTTSPSQASPADTAEPSAQAATPAAQATGGVAATPSPSAETSAAGADAVNDSELEGQIENALNKEPTLTGDSTHVTVSADTIELAGNVGTSKEKLTATRIVQSYAGNKKVMNHLTISGKGEPRTPQQETPDANHPASSTNPATNPEPNKSSQPPAQPPLS